MFAARPFVLAVLSLLLIGGSEMRKPVRTDSVRTFSRSPLRFEPVDSGRFVAQAGKTRLTLDAHGALFDDDVTMRVAGGRDVTPVASSPLPTHVNRLRGSDRSQWQRNVPTYGKVTYPNVRDGVDLVFHGEHGQLEYDFVVAPGTEASDVVLEIEGGEATLASNGALAIGGNVHERPRVYQGEREIAASYRLVDSTHVAFNIDAYDHTQPLVIDPVAGYTSFFGGLGSELVSGIATDALGNVYLAGATADYTTFPAATAKVFGPAPNPSATDAFVAKIDPNGSLVYFTVISGSNTDSADAVAIDEQGRAVVGGWTYSDDLPTTSDAAQKKLATAGQPVNQDAYLFTLSADGSDLAYASYLDVGTNDHPHACPDPTHSCFIRHLYSDSINSIAVDAGTIFIAGRVDFAGDTDQDRLPGNDLPTFPVAGDVDTSAHGSFVAAISNGKIAARRFTGGGAYGSGSVAVTGDTVFVASYSCFDFNTVTVIKPGSYQDNPGGVCDGFLASFDRSLATLKWGTWLGGNEEDEIEQVVAVSPAEVYVTGTTKTAPAQDLDGYVARFDTTVNGPSSLAYFEILGGAGSDSTNGIALLPNGNTIVAGSARSTEFPVARSTNTLAAFLIELAPNGSVVKSTLVDGTASSDFGFRVAYAPGGPILLGDSTLLAGGGADDFPNTKNLQPGRGGGHDAFIARIPDGTDPDDPTGTTALALAPLSATVPPRGHVQLKATNGTPPYAFSFASNASGATVDNNGGYVAGAHGAVSDQVRVTDATGQTKTASITIGPGITISPNTAAIAQNQTKTFTATGGAGEPYTWTASAGTIDASGHLKAPASNVVVVVTATDSLGNTASANVAVGAAVAITPTNPSVVAGGNISFTAFGGTGAYTYTATNGGTIDASTGFFTAGPIAGHETVQVTDTAGNHASTDVTVLAGATSVTPPASTPTPPPTSTTSSSSSSSGTTNAASPSEDSGCDCRTGSSSSSQGGAVFTALLGLLAVRRRRK